MELYLNTVSELLWKSLQKLMSLEEFKPFRIVGGTSLSLQLGHRESIDIDLFTDYEYNSIDFDRLGKVLINTFPYVEKSSTAITGMGTSFFVGNNEKDLLKLDLYYTDPFVFPCIIENNIRFASIEEIIAMKLDVIVQGGRKKDFWDIHELLDTYSLKEMLNFYNKRYPYGYDEKEVLTNLTNFSNADDDFEPNCYKGKCWEIIKIDFEELAK
ncbi:MAG: nucleotidyl transferase AbiEii/AbiGii toxin family protein [Flavobacteriaceae bacterium]|nr:nucleotidyl transferase AbiEii/AbiGii toxin family protein [Flavobacteriaceae bacterium]